MGLKQNGEKKCTDLIAYGRVQEKNNLICLRNINYSRNSLNYVNYCESQHVLEMSFQNLCNTIFIGSFMSHIYTRNWSQFAPVNAQKSQPMKNLEK